TSRCSFRAATAGRHSRNFWRAFARRSGNGGKTARVRSRRLAKSRLAKSHAGQRARQQPHALASRYRRPGRKHIVVALPDLLEDAHAAAAEQIEIERQPAADHSRKRQTLLEQGLRAIHHLAHGGSKRRCRPPGRNLFHARTVASQSLERNIDPILLEI